MTNKRTILIAGATGSIGGGAASALARRGARVALLGHSPDRLRAKMDLVRVASSEARNEDPDLDKRWPSGLRGLIWRIMKIFRAKPPAVAGEPIADLMLSHQDRSSINGASFILDKRVEKPDKAMNDAELGRRLWHELERLTGVTPR